MKPAVLVRSVSCLLPLAAVFLAACDKPGTPEAAPPAVTAPPSSPAAAETVPAAVSASPEAPAPSDPAADPLSRFKTEVSAIRDFMEANQGSEDPAAGLANTRELIRRAGAVSTEGLPEDLAKAFQEMSRVMRQLQSTLDDLPVPADQLPAYISAAETKGGAEADEVKAKVEAFSTAMRKLEEEGEAAAAKLREVGAKYGVESLELGSR